MRKKLLGKPSLNKVTGGFLMSNIDNRRVVVTGLGLCCALGDNVSECWNSAVNGVTGIKKITSFSTDDCYANIGAESHLPSKELSDEELIYLTIHLKRINLGSE